jgi:hypothetical protein
MYGGNSQPNIKARMKKLSFTGAEFHHFLPEKRPVCPTRLCSSRGRPFVDVPDLCRFAAVLGRILLPQRQGIFR